MSKEDEQLQQLTNDFAEFKTELTKKDEKISALQNEINQMKQRSKKVSNEQFAEELVSNGNITPSVKNFVIDFLAIADNQGTYDFSEGEEKCVKTRFKDFLKGLKSVNFKKVVTNKTADDTPAVDFSDATSIAKAIDVIIKEGKAETAADAYLLLKETQE